MSGLELWGGHECTVNRVGDLFRDQTRLSGHHDRLDDLDRFAELGVAALRYPVLWERVAPDHADEADFTWSDARLARLGQLGIRPIVGLVHHGSGPAYTHLLDEGFASGLGAYARRVAERYPHVRDWTPVNEPLTTARFSCLYGHWYPHQADERLFWTALLNQVDGTRLAMRQIRAVNPQARLIQTEDLGRTYGTPPLTEQVAYENARRWMTWDLLCGRVTPDHVLWDRLCGFGLEGRLRAVADDPCPPDVLGINTYLTSERFLDHRIEDYPPHTRGGNGKIAYADVEAVRVLTPAPLGVEGAMEETWARYGRPIAITERHNGCTHDEQIRWFRDGWEAANRLRADGLPIEAVTAWSLLGAHDWNSLLTRPAGHYEPGVFDIRGPAPRATAMARFLKSLGDPAAAPHPAATGPGWWRRDIRLEHRPVFRGLETPEPRRVWRADGGAGRPILIVGATGTLGKAFARACEHRALDYVLTRRPGLDLAAPASIAAALDRHAPWAVINAAGWVRVDQAETDCAGCFAANAEGAVRLAAACAERGIPLVGFSSDLVFDGQVGRAYRESDAVAPLNAYGASKAQAERETLALGGKALVIRTAAFFSPYDPYNFAVHVLRSLAAGEPVEAAEDLVVSPTYVPHLTDAALDLLIDGETGLWHLANEGEASWAEFAVRLAKACGRDAAGVRPRRAAEFGWPARRPAYVPLTSERGLVMPSLDQAIAAFASAAAIT